MGAWKERDEVKILVSKQTKGRGEVVNFYLKEYILMLKLIDIVGIWQIAMITNEGYCIP